MTDCDALSSASQKWDVQTGASALAKDEAAVFGEGAAGSSSLYSNPKVDATSGATPGVATACRDFGVATLEDAAKRFGCKPPGQS